MTIQNEERASSLGSSKALFVASAEISIYGRLYFNFFCFLGSSR